MGTLLSVTALCTGLAWASERSAGPFPCGRKVRWDLCLFLAVAAFTLFVGLRTNYNDTRAYIQGFRNAGTFSEFLSDPDNLDPMHNPLFYGATALSRTLTDNYHLYFLAFAALDTTLFFRFLQRYAGEQDFGFSMYLFFCMGTAVFSLAAMKQVTAMAVLTLAIPALLDKRWLRFGVVVALAGLIHTYAFLFAILPLCVSRPWNMRTFLLIAGTILVMWTFDSSISTVLSYADTMGKHVAEYEVFDGNRMNFLRVAVYGVVPAITLVFRRRLVSRMNRAQRLLTNMSVISLMFMLLGTVNGANMFGRVATYFELGAICMLPWCIRELFTPRSAQVVRIGGGLFFLVFFLYDNLGFSHSYATVTIVGFLKSFS